MLLKLGEAKGRYRAGWRLLDLVLPQAEASGALPEPAAPDIQPQRETSGATDERREGPAELLLPAQSPETTPRAPARRPLFTSYHLCGHNPDELWQLYLQLTEVEAAFKNLKDDLQLRPIYHQLEHRIEAHIFVAFMAYCLHINLRARLKPSAPGLTSRAVLDTFAGIQMVDGHFPTSDGRTLILSRYNRAQPRPATSSGTTQPDSPAPTTPANNRRRSTRALKQSSHL